MAVDAASAGFDVVQQGEVIAQDDLIADVDPNLVVDFGARNLDVAVSASDTFALNMDGLRGSLTEVSGNLTIDAFGFFRVEGGFAFERSIGTVTDADGNEISVDRLRWVLVASMRSWASTAADDATGLDLQELDFALALHSERGVAEGVDARTWTSLQASTQLLALTGIDGFTLEGESLAVSINQAAADGSVLDFSGDAGLAVTTGPGTSLTLDADGARGELLEASGTLTLGIADFVSVSGSFGFTSATETITLDDASTVTADALLIGGSDLDALPGSAPARTMRSASISMASSSALRCSPIRLIPQAGPRPGERGQPRPRRARRVHGVRIGHRCRDQSRERGRFGVDFGAMPLRCTVFGEADTLDLTLDGALGETVQLEGSFEFSVADFVAVSGSIGFSRSVPATRRLLGVGENIGSLAAGDAVSVSVSGAAWSHRWRRRSRLRTHRRCIRCEHQRLRGYHRGRDADSVPNATTSVDAGTSVDVLDLSYTFSEAPRRTRSRSP